MKRSELDQASTPESLAEHVARNAPALRQSQHEHVRATESVREATYRGHQIVIRTSYHIEVDGVAVEGHLDIVSISQTSPTSPNAPLTSSALSVLRFTLSLSSL